MPKLATRTPIVFILGMVVLPSIIACAFYLWFAPISTLAVQRLCEHSDNAVAKISPCTGPSGTTVAVTLRRTLTSPPKSLVFRSVLGAAGIQGRVTTPINNLVATVPPQLCMRGGGRWEVWLVDERGRSQGLIGAFWPECSGATNSNANGSGGGGNTNPGGGGGNNNGNNNKNSNLNGGDGAAGPIDQCLVGTWLATSVKDANPRILGGGDGFRVTFTRDGLQTVDYSAMKPFQMDGDSSTYSGAATARVSTKSGTAKVVRITKRGVLFHMSSTNEASAMPMPGLGPGGLGETTGDNSYVCTKDSLQYESSMSAGRRPHVTVKLTRQKN